MATVKIGDKELVVRGATLGFLKKLLPAKRKMREAEAADDDARKVDALAELIHCYVGEPVNEGITVEWLLENLPMDPTSIMGEIFGAAGQKVAQATSGEAFGQ